METYLSQLPDNKTQSQIAKSKTANKNKMKIIQKQGYDEIPTKKRPLNSQTKEK